MATLDTNNRIGAFVAASGFVLLTVGFHLLDPYRTLFFSTGRFGHLFHIGGRLAFVVYFVIIHISLGQLALTYLKRRGIELSLALDEEVAISFLCGSAILRILMLVLGFSELYSWWLMALIATATVGLGWPRISQICRAFSASCRETWRSAEFERFALMGTCLAAAGATGAVIVEKGLFPNGTGDYFSHYLPYFQYVIARGDIWPNEVWYHFFISKAAGDIVFAVLLTDLLGPQAVSCTMFFAALLIMFSFVRRATDDVLVGLAATTATAIAFIWTFETAIGFGHWAEFPKEHVTTATLFFGCVWASWRQRDVPGPQLNGWSVLVSIGYVGLVLLRVQFALLVILFLAMMAAWAWRSGKRDLAWSYMLPVASVAATAIALLCVNYAVMGVAEVTPFRFFWSFADQAQFARWVSPFLMLLLDIGSSPNLGSLGAPDLYQFRPLTLLAAVFRLDRSSPFIWPWGLPLVLASGLAIFGLSRRSITPLSHTFSAGTTMLIMLVAAAGAFLSINQIGSLYRLYMFCMFPIIGLASLTFAAARVGAGPAWRVAIGLVLAMGLLSAVPREIAKIPAESRRLELRFATGGASIADAYASQNAVWPAALAMTQVVGPSVPIWASQVGWHFCVAPECNLQTFFSFSMGRDWATIMFEPAEVAQAALRRNGINFFAIDTNSPFFDVLPYSPLFAADGFSDRFGVVWSADGVYLLTWRSSITSPITQAFLDGYAKSLKSALPFADFPALHRVLSETYGGWKADPKWPVVLDPSIPRPRGWQ